MLPSPAKQKDESWRRLPCEDPKLGDQLIIINDKGNDFFKGSNPG
jgi:hypothetical protein